MSNGISNCDTKPLSGITENTEDRFDYDMGTITLIISNQGNSLR